ncbi:MAG: 5'/3'-nucleotidase SurE [Candidatus Diapherotrites archaeon]|nr:5'/3'-nucleotidase SurE [Candidatus Diapherotrites archaeon]
MKQILLTNDDGYQSVGFYPLLKELEKSFSVTSVAPESERSWIGKSITAKKELKVKKINLNGIPIYVCSGTPADCSQLGIYEFSKKRPDLVVSGINIGANVGHGRILSSGTIGAAMEAAIDEVKALASSLQLPDDIRKSADFFHPKNYSMFENAAKITAKIAKIVVQYPFEKGVDILSINIPFEATVENKIQITRPHREPYHRLFAKKNEGYSKKSIGDSSARGKIDFTYKIGTDSYALSKNKISITPISLNLSREESFKKLNQLLKKNWSSGQEQSLSR